MSASAGDWTGDVRALLATDLVTPATRQALTQRLSAPRVDVGRFFAADSLRTLQAVCARLLPQSERTDPIDIAGVIDGRLADGKGDGWRYDVLPADGEAYQLGLREFDRHAHAQSGAPFHALAPVDQDRVLVDFQRGEVPTWTAEAARRFFEELLAEATESYYSHPIAQQEIGYVGMADAPGWQAIGLDQREAREPRRGQPTDG
ncbi:MAG: gluconate 2-dehydrogenase subunit 3 family protein [Planctomycetes bacterium]|nr:gluconate 2-dehydrogenase subunit 3 family protein [Planctomycetota bacterium]